jgi:hypothetical protein
MTMRVRTWLPIVALAGLCAATTGAGAQIQIAPGGGTVIPNPGLSNGLPVIVRPLPSPDTLARERQLRNQITRDRIGARYARPEIPRASVEPDGRGRAGRSDLDPARAGDFARQGPAAIGRSSVTRPSLGARR